MQWKSSNPTHHNHRMHRLKSTSMKFQPAKQRKRLPSSVQYATRDTTCTVGFRNFIQKLVLFARYEKKLVCSIDQVFKAKEHYHPTLADPSLSMLCGVYHVCKAKERYHSTPTPALAFCVTSTKCSRPRNVIIPPHPTPPQP